MDPTHPNQMDFSQSAWRVSGQPVPSKTRIDIEKFTGSILITVGEKDEVWPVAQTRRIEATLKTAGLKPEVHYFPQQGHTFWGTDETKRRELVLEFVQR